jgi:hypothetical protein
MGTGTIRKHREWIKLALLVGMVLALVTAIHSTSPWGRAFSAIPLLLILVLYLEQLKAEVLDALGWRLPQGSEPQAAQSPGQS